MKHLLPTRIAPYFLFLCVSLFFIGCVEKEILELDPNHMEYVEEPSIEDEQDVPGPVTEVRSEDVPHIIGSISELTGSKSLGSKSVYYKKAVIDMNTILKVKDKKNKRTNYTFPVYVTGQTEGEFFNLIVSEDEKGKASKPYVRHYVVNPAYLEEYLASGEDFAHFKGTYYRYRFDSFFDAMDLGKGSRTLKGSDCDTDGTTVGPTGTGDPQLNPNLIQEDGANQWTGGNYVGYVNLPSWSQGTTSQEQTTEAYVNSPANNSNEYTSPVSTTSYGIAQVKTENDLMDVDLHHVVSSSITTEDRTGGGSFFLTDTGKICTIKVTVSITYLNGTSVIVTTYSGCDGDTPVRKAASSQTAAATDCPDCTGEGVVAVLPRSVINSIKNALNLNYFTPEFTWISDSENIEEVGALNNFILANTVGGVLDPLAKEFGLEALEAWMDGRSVDVDEAVILAPTPDDNYNYQGPREYIPNPLVLPNGDSISINFGTTESDNKNANNKVSVDLIEAIKFAIQKANSNLSTNNKITSIRIFATTNGAHGTRSNHYNGTAVDISAINGDKMSLTGLTGQITEMQKAFDDFEFIRENFGPDFKHKYSKETNTWNYNHPVGGHKDHIHISVRR